MGVVQRMKCESASYVLVEHERIIPTCRGRSKIPGKEREDLVFTYFVKTKTKKDKHWRRQRQRWRSVGVLDWRDWREKAGDWGANLVPNPPNFPRYISSPNAHHHRTKCHREINKKEYNEVHIEKACLWYWWEDWHSVFFTFFNSRSSQNWFRSRIGGFSELLHLSLVCRNDLIPVLHYKMFCLSLFLSFCPCCSLLNIWSCPLPPFISTFAAQIFAFHLGRKKKQVVFGRQILPLTHCVLSKHTTLHRTHSVYCSKFENVN